jgi:hypothetical protein
MSTYRTWIQFENNTTATIVSAALRYSTQHFQGGQLEAFFTEHATQTEGDVATITGSLRIAPKSSSRASIEIYERWGQEPIKITLTFDNGHVIDFDCPQRCAYSDYSGESIVTRHRGSKILDNLSVVLRTSREPDHGMVIFSLSQDNVALDNRRWMAKVNSDLPLSNINLAGSHDSASIFDVPTLWATQKSNITEQLNAGTRALDVRLKVFSTSAAHRYEFFTCHGFVTAGKAIGVYQSFESLIAECQQFLALNGTEALVMSIKVDDWNGFEAEAGPVLESLYTLLKRYPLFITHDMPTLRKARGKIFLFNRINFDDTYGVPLPIADNQHGLISHNGFPIYFQDHYAYGSGTLSDAQGDKQTRVIDAFELSTPDGVKWNFVSAAWGIGGVQPVGVDINQSLLSWLGSRSVAQRPQKLGWCFFDQVTTRFHTVSASSSVPGTITWPEMIIASNLGYSNHGGASFTCR